MKVLPLLVSLSLTLAVVVFFLRPWEDVVDPERSAGWAERNVSPAVPPARPVPNAPPDVAGSSLPKPTDSDPVLARPAEPKTHLLASEEAEAARNAASGDRPHAIAAPPAPTKRYFKVKVRDAGTLDVDLPTASTVVIRIEGIRAREANETCTTATGVVWPCGTKARAALSQLIRARAVTCTLPPGGERSDFAARCSVKGHDLATWLVRRGWATPKDNAEPVLAQALQAAKTERLGLWQSE
jgi:endonuclease YncB( thermonuclease family)